MVYFFLFEAGLQPQPLPPQSFGPATSVPSVLRSRLEALDMVSMSRLPLYFYGWRKAPLLRQLG